MSLSSASSSEMNKDEVGDDREESLNRYTRATLYLIKNESGARKKPPRDLQVRLQLLGIWRIGQGSGGGALESAESGVVGGGSSYSDLNSRTPRPTSVRGGGDGAAPFNSSANYLSGHSGSPSNILDHRSISSAHLMPAFAKRRIVATTQNTSPASVSRRTPTEGRDESPLESSRGRMRNKDDDSKRTADDQDVYHASNRKLSEEIFDRDAGSDGKRNMDKAKGSSSPASNQNQRPGPLNTERRIGSGRLLHPYGNWDSRSPENDFFTSGKASEKDFSGANSQRSMNRIPDRFNDKRAFNRKGVEERGYDKPHPKNSMPNNRSGYLNDGADSLKGSHHHQNQNRHRRSYNYNDRNEEPEWFSGGPTSQHDTIELHGFDDLEEPSSNNADRKASEHNSQDADRESFPFASQVRGVSEMETNGKKRVDSERNLESQSDSHQSNAKNINSQAATSIDPSNESRINECNIVEYPDKPESRILDESSHGDFNFDNFLNLESLEENIRGGNDGRNNSAVIEGSRFSRWFGNSDKQTTTTPTTSDVKKETHPKRDDSNHSNMLMEFIQQAKLKTDSVPIHATIQSVEELEARMRKLDGNDAANASMQKPVELPVFMENGNGCNVPSDHVRAMGNITPDTEAFKKLLEQLGSDAKKPTEMPMQPLPEHNEKFGLMRNGEMNGGPPHAGHPLNFEGPGPIFHHGRPNIQMINDFVLPHVVAFFNGNPQKIMEAEHVLKGLIIGEITVQFLEQKLHSQNTPPHMKEIICSVLPHFETAMKLSNIHPMLPPPCYPQQMHSPVPIAVLPHPSLGQANPHMMPPLPEDLLRMQGPRGSQPHDVGVPKPNSQERDPEARPMPPPEAESQPNMTDLMPLPGPPMHQRMLPAHMPIVQPPLSVQTSTPTPLAFTPTSVLRKMTADKEISHLENRSILARPFLDQQQQAQSQQHPQSTEQSFLHQLPTIMPRMILGGHSASQQQQQQLNNGGASQLSPQSIESQQQAAQMRNAQSLKWQKPLEGRPILKGPLIVPMPPQPSAQQNMIFANKMEHQLAQRVKNNPQLMNTGFPMGQPQMFPHPQRIFTVPRQFPMQPMLQPPHAPQQIDIPNRIINHSTNEIMNAPDAELKPNVMNYQRDGKLSPTSNQLAQWFSPELLAQASAGKLPLLNVNQALSLEEFERSIQHSSATVHN